MSLQGDPNRPNEAVEELPKSGYTARHLTYNRRTYHRVDYRKLAELYEVPEVAEILYLIEPGNF